MKVTKIPHRFMVRRELLIKVIEKLFGRRINRTLINAIQE